MFVAGLDLAQRRVPPPSLSCTTLSPARVEVKEVLDRSPAERRQDDETPYQSPGYAPDVASETC